MTPDKKASKAKLELQNLVRVMDVMIVACT